MITYLIRLNGIIQKSIDGKSVISFPQAKDNQDFREYLKWVDGGGVPDVEQAPPAPSDDEKIKRDTTAEISLGDFIDAFFTDKSGDKSKLEALQAKWVAIKQKHGK